jgi:hypothetical protein
MKEATKGYFTDLNATRRHGGKTWIAPNVMIREDVCSIFLHDGKETDGLPESTLFPKHRRVEPGYEI